MFLNRVLNLLSVPFLFQILGSVVATPCGMRSLCVKLSVLASATCDLVSIHPNSDQRVRVRTMQTILDMWRVDREARRGCNVGLDGCVLTCF